MPLSIEAQSRLRRIRADVMDGKWIQGFYTGFKKPDHHCLVGFVRVEEVDEVRYEVHGALFRAIRERWYPYDSVQSWNDRDSTTKEDVVRLIDYVLTKGVQADGTNQG